MKNWNTNAFQTAARLPTLSDADDLSDDDDSGSAVDAFKYSI